MCSSPPWTASGARAPPAARSSATPCVPPAVRPPGDGDWRAAYLDVLRELTEHDAPGVAAAGLASVARAARARPRRRGAAARRGARRDARPHAPDDRDPRRGRPGPRADGARTRARCCAATRCGAGWRRGSRTGSWSPGFAAGVEDVLEHPEWLALEGRRIVLLGAGAEMGPLEQLAAWGADVLAVDLPSQAQRVQALARAGAGTVRTPGDGADLLAALPELRAWIGEHDDGRDLVVASHVYADGGAHVRLAAAADALVADLPGAAFAALATPTDCYLAPDDAVREARRRWERRGALRLLQAPLRAASAGRLLRPAYAGGRRLADGLVRQQGPELRARQARPAVARDAGRRRRAHRLAEPRPRDRHALRHPSPGADGRVPGRPALRRGGLRARHDPRAHGGAPRARPARPVRPPRRTRSRTAPPTAACGASPTSCAPPCSSPRWPDSRDPC